jgi:O-antigen biosynthesis protein WbqP
MSLFIKGVNSLKRIFDIIFSFFAIVILLVPFIIISILIKVTSKGPVIYWSRRVGKDNHFFMMPKFRTMNVNAPQVATHLLISASSHITPLGKILRKSSLDEIPQLISVLKGDMSLVGPRPALFNQDDLIAQRTKEDIHKLVPGVTGWAQINGRDENSITEKVKLDRYYLQNMSSFFDLKIILLTAFKVVLSKNITE